MSYFFNKSIFIKKDKPEIKIYANENGWYKLFDFNRKYKTDWSKYKILKTTWNTKFHFCSDDNWICVKPRKPYIAKPL